MPAELIIGAQGIDYGTGLTTHPQPRYHGLHYFTLSSVFQPRGRQTAAPRPHLGTQVTGTPDSVGEKANFTVFFLITELVESSQEFMHIDLTHAVERKHRLLENFSKSRCKVMPSSKV